jgi:hypothetical protein
MADSVAALFERSLRHVLTEVPASYQHLVRVLGPLVVEVRIGGRDDEAFTLCADQARLAVSDGASTSAGARIRTTRTAILQVLDGVVSLAEAVESGQLEVWGSLDAVLRAHDTLIAYAHAATRAPSVPGLLSALRADASGGAR